MTKAAPTPKGHLQLADLSLKATDKGRASIAKKRLTQETFKKMKPVTLDWNAPKNAVPINQGEE